MRSDNSQRSRGMHDLCMIVQEGRREQAAGRVAAGGMTKARGSGSPFRFLLNLDPFLNFSIAPESRNTLQRVWGGGCLVGHSRLCTGTQVAARSVIGPLCRRAKNAPDEETTRRPWPTATRAWRDADGAPRLRVESTDGIGRTLSYLLLKRRAGACPVPSSRCMYTPHILAPPRTETVAL